MKKLIAMIGAVAMSFGLFAAGNAPFAISYEATETEAGVSGGEWTPGTKWSWNGDVIPVITDDARVLPYEGSGSKARRNGVFLTVTGGTDNHNYADLSTGTDELTLAVDSGNIFLDQLVKFTGFEDPQTNVVAGTKIAIWMSEFENADESTTTNLFITCGKNVDGTYEQVALAINTNSNYKLNTWYRLTVKSLGDIFDGAAGSTARAGFLVWINGEKAICEDAKQTLGGDADLISDSKKAAFYNAGRLFPAFAASDTLATVGYQGIGAIDDIIVDDDGPEFCVETIDVSFNEITGAVIAKVVDGDGVEFDHPTGTIAVKPGDLTVTLEAAEGYKMTSDGEYTVDASTEGQKTVPVEEGDFVEVYATKNGTVEYGEAELYTMITGLVDEDVVVFNLDSTINDGAEDVYEFSQNATINVTDDDGAITWDVAVSNANEAAGWYVDNVGVDAGNTLNVWFETDEEAYMSLNADVAGTLKVEVGTLVVESDIEVSGTLEAAALSIDSTIALAVGGKVITADGEFDDETITVPENYELDVQGPDEDDLYTYSAAQSGPEPTTDTVTFTVTYDADEVENVTVTTNGEDVVKLGGLCYVVESNAFVTITATAKTGYQNVTIEGDNVTVGEDGVFKADKAETAITITAEPIPADVAEIVGGGKYTTLQAAVEAAQDDDVIKLLDNYTAADTESIIFMADVTFDLNGKTLTLTDAQRDGKKFAMGAEGLGGPDVTITNGTIHYVSGGCGRGFNVYGGTLTVACTFEQTAGGSQPVFDIYSTATINIEAEAVIDAQGGDAFRTKGDLNTACNVNINGGSITCPANGVFNTAKPLPLNVALNGGQISYAGGDLIHSGSSYDSQFICNLDDTCGAKFDTDTAKSSGCGLKDLVKAGYEAVQGGDDWYTIQAIPTYTVAGIMVANASVVATNKTVGGATFALPAVLLRDTQIAVTVTPDTDYEYATPPAGWTKNGNGSITTNATVTANLAITVEAPVAADPWNPPTKDDEASQKVADLGFSQTAAANINTVAEFTMFETYVKTASGKTDPAQLTANQKANAYLAYALNATAIPDAAIESDDVEITSFEGGVIEITIEGITVGSDVSSEMIAKVIDVVGNDELTEMSAANVTTTGRAGVNGKVQVTVEPASDFAESTKFFYRASVKK